MASESREVFYLETKIPGNDPEHIQVEAELTVGSDESADICIQEFGLAPLHCRFRQTNDVLTITNLGGSGKTKIGNQKLEQGKMYILDEDDKIFLGEIAFIVRSGFFEETKVEEISEEHEAGDQSAQEDYEEEGADETFRENKLTSFFSVVKEKATEVFKRAPKEDDEKPRTPAPKIEGSKSVGGPPGKLPAALPRIYGFLISLILIFGIYQHLLPLLGIEEEIPKLLKQLEPHIEKLTAKTPKEYRSYVPMVFNPLYLKFLIIYILWELIGTIVFGISIPLALMGIGGSNGLIINRLKAIFRFVLDLILMPFLIFDLPLLVGKRPLKEFILGINYRYGSRVIKLIGTFILLPSLVLATFAFPLLPIAEQILNPVMVTEFKAPKRKKVLKKVQTTKSNTLNLSLGLPDKKENVFLPFLEMRGNNFFPTMKMGSFDKKDKFQTGLLITRGKTLNLEEIVKELNEKDPLLPFTSPSLVQYAKDKKLNILVSSELGKIIQNSLTMSLPELHLFLLAHGVFFEPYIKLRQQILDSVGLSSIKSFTTIDTKGPTFLVLDAPGLKGHFSSSFLSIDDGFIHTFNLSYDKKSQKIMMQFRNDSLMNSKKLKEGNGLGDKTIYNAFDVLDLFTMVVDGRGKNLKLTNDIIRRATLYYIEQGQQILQEPKDQEKVKSEFLRVMKKNDKNLAKLGKLKKHPLIEEWRLSLNRVQKAVENNDQKFFKANLNP